MQKTAVTFQNRFNGDRVICEDIKRDKKFIDGIEYYLVHEPNSPRRFLMRKEALEKVGR